VFSKTVHGVQFHDRYFGEFNGAAQVVRFQYPLAEYPLMAAIYKTYIHSENKSNRLNLSAISPKSPV
jgi:hypothetical protein